MTDSERYGIGGNSPPPDLKIGEALREELRDNNHAMEERRDELLAGAGEFDADHATVEDDETSGLLAGIITQINKASKQAHAVREGIKAPYLEGGRIVDAFFTGGIATPLDKMAEKLNAKQTAYQRDKAARAKKEAEEAAARARAEEDARRKEAEKAERERVRAEREAKKAHEDAAASAAASLRAQEAAARADVARKAEEDARVERENAARIAASTAAERSRTRGDYAMASLRTTWDYEILEIAKVPALFLTVNDKVVKALIRGKDGMRVIPGLRIFAVEESVNR